MAVPWRPLAWKALLCGAAALLLWTAGRTAWRLQVGADLVRRSAPWQRSLAQPALRLLIVGDSTAVGTGASGSASGLAGLLGQAFPRLLIENRARDGATFADLPAQLRGPARFDLVLVMAGGNDVVRLRALPALRDDIDRVLALAHARAGQVVLMPAGNVGNAPFF
nr:GDSL-type esterase/lipase family protein [Aquabacterium sp.]